MNITTKYDLGQVVYVKTGRFSAEEEVGCPVCKGVGEFKADLKFEDGSTAQDVPVQCTECEGIGTIITREPRVAGIAVLGISVSVCRNSSVQVRYDLSLDSRTIDMMDIAEQHVYTTPEEAEAGITV